MMNNDHRQSVLFILVAACLAWTGLVAAASPATMSSPQRIVVVGGGLTEIIYSLGEAHRIVGVDTTSRWPESALKLPQIGYQRSLSAEGVLSLQPDLVLATADAGPPAVLAQIRGAGIAVDVLPHDHSVAGVATRVKAIAKLLGRTQKGQVLIERILSDVEKAQRHSSLRPHIPRVLFLLNVGSGPPLASGRNTAASSIIHLAGGKNVFNQFEGYKPVAAEAIVAAAPDFLLLISHRKEGVADPFEDILSIPGVAQTSAGKHLRVINMDGLKLLGFGPRIGEAVAELSQQLFSGPAARMGLK